MAQVQFPSIVIIDPNYNPFANCDERGIRHWHLFGLFLAREWAGNVEGAFEHIEWLLQRPFLTPDEWLGDEGAKFRARYGMREATDDFKQRWQTFLAQNDGCSMAEIEQELDALLETP